jgi:type II secretory pathway pseudopilin PulG
MRINGEKGFTLTELTSMIAILSFLIMLYFPVIAGSGPDAKEEEVKENVHRIQMALEKYATDNRHYPAMIWGGDKKGWTPKKGYGCRTMWEHEPYNGKNENTAIPPLDPLIAYGYLDTYPRNPFISPGDGVKYTIKWTGPSSCALGEGDVRFGYCGEKMGNILEDPHYLWIGPGIPSRVKNTFPDGSYNNYSGMLNKNLPGNPFYAMGGMPPWTDNKEDIKTSFHPDRDGTLSAYWPGEFFYRSRGVYEFPKEFLIFNTKTKDPGLKYLWDFKYSTINSYILGGYGSLQTSGMDIIRLTDQHGCTINNTEGYCRNIFYNPNKLYPRTSTTRVHFSSPEIEGGGQWGVMPIFPNEDPESNIAIWGAADGFRDGVIFATTNNATLVLEWDSQKGIVQHGGAVKKKK